MSESDRFPTKTRWTPRSSASRNPVMWAVVDRHGGLRAVRRDPGAAVAEFADLCDLLGLPAALVVEA